MIGQMVGPYQVLSKLGEGGMGEVYRARDSKLNRDVALKVLPASVAGDPAARARFEREAHAVAALSHPNILAIHDFGVDGSIPFAVLELLDGATLRDRLIHGALPPRKAVEYAQQLAAGLAAAHTGGVIHRDLKPENVFVTRDGRVKILDFGLARLTEVAAAGQTSQPTVQATSPGTVLGTVGYMSPEQVRGLDVDHRADIFALGAILYEMLAGRRAFRGDSAVETMNAILKEDPPELATTAALPPAFDRIVRRCLEKNPDERFQSARDLGFALEAFSGSTPAAAATSGGELQKRRRFVLGAAAATAAVALAAAACYVGARTTRTAPTAEVSYRQLTSDRGTVRAARFTPDGQTIVYSAAWGGAPLKVFVTRADADGSSALDLPDAHLFSVSPNGELAISLGHRFDNWIGTGTLARTPLVGGGPREMMENIREAEWDRSGRDLAVVRRVDDRDRLEYPAGTTLHSTSGYISGLRFSPAGDAIAFFDHPIFNDNRGSVSIAALSGGITTLTSDWHSVDGLAWRPGTDELWFSGTRSGEAWGVLGATRSGQIRSVLKAPVDLMLHDIASDGRVLLSRIRLPRENVALLAGESRERDVSWSTDVYARDIAADGRALLWTRFGERSGPYYSVYFQRAGARQAALIGEGEGASLSPDGRTALSVVYASPTRVMVLPTGAGDPKTLPGAGLVHQWASWFPDGKHVLISARDASGPNRFYMQDATSGEGPRPITEAGVTAFAFGMGVPISPDGSSFVAQAPDRRAMIYPVAGGPPRPLRGIQPGEIPILWQREGGIIAYRRDELPAVVYRLDLATGARTELRTVMPVDVSGLRVVPQLHMTPDGRWYVYSFSRFISDLYLVNGIR